ncbi:MAG TPA: dTDP-4-dehydrorhamnose reductase [Acidisarcina sp.]
MDLRILLTGSTGQVGVEFIKAGAHLGELIALTRADCDLADPDAIRCAVREIKPDVIVNAAAYTAVDKAESEPQLAFAANATAPGVLAEEARVLGAQLIHYSTDYVFDGSKNSSYVEEDPPCPVSQYGRSKLEGERLILASKARAIILRTSWVYGSHGKNFLLTMLRLAQQRPELRVVADQFGSPTSAGEIARATVRIIGAHNGAQVESAHGAVYHMTAQGVTSWCGFAQAIIDQAELPTPPRVTPIASSEYPTPARRPFNSALANDKFAVRFGFRLRPWQDALKDVMVEIRKAQIKPAAAPLH